ncbi:unnamed protein product, partial [Musa hybrid cultivar]
LSRELRWVGVELLKLAVQHIGHQRLSVQQGEDGEREAGVRGGDLRPVHMLADESEAVVSWIQHRGGGGLAAVPN